MYRLAATLLTFVLLSACLPTGQGVPTGASAERYERAKANRESYMYQGL